MENLNLCLFLTQSCRMTFEIWCTNHMGLFGSFCHVNGRYIYRLYLCPMEKILNNTGLTWGWAHNDRMFGWSGFLSLHCWVWPHWCFFRGCGIALGGLLSNPQVICTSLQKRKTAACVQSREKCVLVNWYFSDWKTLLGWFIKLAVSPSRQ